MTRDGTLKGRRHKSLPPSPFRLRLSAVAVPALLPSALNSCLPAFLPSCLARVSNTLSCRARQANARVYCGFGAHLSKSMKGLLPALAAMLTGAAPAAGGAQATFARDVAPILYEHCAPC